SGPRQLGRARRITFAVTSVWLTLGAPLAAQKTPKPNQPPNVSLSSPSNGSSYQAPASVTLSANANDSDGSVVVVEFYAGQTLVGQDTKKPYSVTWAGVAAGTYVLTAVARDNKGAIETSSTRTILVNGTPSTS